METIEQSPMYPRLLRRVRAVLIDEFILLAALAAWWLSLGIMEDADLLLKIGSLFLVFLILDPALVAWTGGTIGHHIMGLKVRAATRDAKINFVTATIRGFVRYSLGWLSLVFILVTRRHQAIHDYVSLTIVVLRNPETLSNNEKFAERTGHAL
jgi:uncharacterized RDD family membrane protein YckC